MNDIEITRLCAEAMGLTPYCIQGILQECGGGGIYVVSKTDTRGYRVYDPRNDKAQAMELVIALQLSVGYSAGWGCVKNDDRGMILSGAFHFDDLLRAICTCVSGLRMKGER